ncbi:MAG: hypothetical protein K9M45_12000 [Kiritimatiellales bacterium]|nr:hypothetical protein [Kiritimatiellales bacterium]
MKKILMLCFCLSALVLFAEEKVQRVFKTYPVNYVKVEDVKAVVQEFLGPGSKVSTMPNVSKLYVVATPEEHEMVVTILTGTNKPRKNIMIEVRFKESGSSSDTGVSVGIPGTTVYKNGKLHSPGIHVDARNNSGTSRSDTLQMLTVMDGMEGRLRVGESVPYLDWMVQYGHRHGYMAAAVNWRDVGSYLVVKAELVSDTHIRVQLTPELSGLVDGNPYRVKYQQAATEVIVASGSTIRIGGMNKDEEFYNRFLIGIGKSGAKSTLDISLTPKISGGAAADAAKYYPERRNRNKK